MERTKPFVFISYSKADTEWLNRVNVHLRPLIRDGTLEAWDDTHIRPGMVWHEEIKRALAKSTIAVLLLSPDFFASDFVAHDELPPLLHKASEGGVLILPVMVRHCLHDISTLGISKHKYVNRPELPLASMDKHEYEAILVSLARTIESHSRAWIHKDRLANFVSARTIDGVTNLEPRLDAPRSLPKRLPVALVVGYALAFVPPVIVDPLLIHNKMGYGPRHYPFWWIFVFVAPVVWWSVREIVRRPRLRHLWPVPWLGASAASTFVLIPAETFPDGIREFPHGTPRFVIPVWLMITLVWLAVHSAFGDRQRTNRPRSGELLALVISAFIAGFAAIVPSFWWLFDYHRKSIDDYPREVTYLDINGATVLSAYFIYWLMGPVGSTWQAYAKTTRE